MAEQRLDVDLAESLDRGRREPGDAASLLVAVALLQEVRRDPGYVRQQHEGVGDEQLTDALAPRPGGPGNLGDQHEHAHVVRVDDGHHRHDVGNPPPAAIRVESLQEAQRRQGGEERERGIRAALRAVEDREWIERHDRRPRQARRSADCAQAEHVGERHQSDRERQRWEAEPDGRASQLRRSPHEVEEQRRRLLRVADDAHDVAHALVVDDAVHEQLVAEQAVPEQDGPQNERDDRQGPDRGDPPAPSQFSERARHRLTSWPGVEPYRPDNLLDRLSSDDTLELQYAQVQRRERELLERHLGIEGGDVLSVGCGTRPGRHLFPAPRYRLVGVDVDPEKVRTAVDWGGADEAFVGQAGELDQLENASFDVVLYRLTLHHVAYQEPLARSFEEAARLLRPGGALVAVEPGLLHPVGAALSIVNRSPSLAVRMHGTPDDVPLSPRALRAESRRVE